MSKMSELDIEKKNYISQYYGKLISVLSYNSAKDEALNEYSNLFAEEVDLFVNDHSIFYSNDFQPIYDNWVEYYESMFYEFIEMPVISDENKKMELYKSYYQQEKQINTIMKQEQDKLTSIFKQIISYIL